VSNSKVGFRWTGVAGKSPLLWRVTCRAGSDGTRASSIFAIHNFPGGEPIKILATTIALLLVPTLTFAQDAQEKKDAAEIKAMIIKDADDMNKSLKLSEPNISARVAYDFWSSGGLLVDLTPDFRYKVDSCDVTPKHIKVISLVPGKAAVATYYNEGNFKLTDADPVDNYMCRVTMVLVNENGKWKKRHAH